MNKPDFEKMLLDYHLMFSSLPNTKKSILNMMKQIHNQAVRNCVDSCEEYLVGQENHQIKRDHDRITTIRAAVGNCQSSILTNIIE